MSCISSLARLSIALTMISSAHAADMLTPIAPVAGSVQAPWLDLYAGAAVAPHSEYGYVGSTVAFNHDLQREGWLFRGSVGDGAYSYYSAPGLKRSVDFQTGDLAVGYQWLLNGIKISTLLGASVEQHANDDPFAEVKGTRAGAKGQVEVFAPLNGFGYFYTLGSISSVWNNYLLLSKLGYRLSDRVSAGPEFLALGNERYDAMRSGAFVSLSITPSAEVTLSGGYSWDRRRNSLNDDSGAYASLHLRSSF